MLIDKLNIIPYSQLSELLWEMMNLFNIHLYPYLWKTSIHNIFLQDPTVYNNVNTSMEYFIIFWVQMLHKK
jgi:hypothetical protein